MPFAAFRRCSEAITSNLEAGMQQTRSAQAGFSLVELLVAVVILAVGLLGLAELQITATKANSQNATVLGASSLAQQVLEEIAALDSGDATFDASNSNADNLEVDNQPWINNPTRTVAGAGTYNISYSVTTTYQGVSNLCQIQVVVESDVALMNVLGNRQRRVEVTTLKRAT